MFGLGLCSLERLRLAELVRDFPLVCNEIPDSAYPGGRSGLVLGWLPAGCMPRVLHCPLPCNFIHLAYVVFHAEGA